jgi:hypothetical protein
LHGRFLLYGWWIGTCVRIIAQEDGVEQAG